MIKSWIKNFEFKFNIKNTKFDINHLFIIEGEQGYKQKLDNIHLSLDITTVYNVVRNQNDFSEIAFLVNDWIKIQDSLEMIFNLLTGSSIRSLDILSYLRRNKISAYDFAMYLYTNHNLILINRFDQSNSRKSQLNKIKNLIRAHKQVTFLMVGDRDYLSIKTMVYKFACILHPSGVNLNLLGKEYYGCWYKLDDKFLKYNKGKLSLSDFNFL